MKTIMHILFLSCHKASELIEKRMHFPLSRKEKIQLKAHKMMCDACTRYEKQSSIIERGISESQKPGKNGTDLKDLKLAIEKKLAEHK